MKNPINIFFRIDSSYKIGSGHLIRCLRIAESLSKKNKIYFITNKFAGNFNSLIIKYNILYLKNKESKQNQIQDYKQTKLLLQKIKGKKILFLDHYKLNVLWQKNISTLVNKLIVIQDEIKKNYCDYYINENFFIKKPDTKNLKVTKCLIGPKYCIIKKSLKKNKSKDGLFIFFGGTDTKNITYKILLKLKKITNYPIYVVIGIKNKNKNKILSLSKNSIKFIDKYSNLSIILDKCDKAIVAAGSVLWELIQKKIQIWAVCTAKNQKYNLYNLKKCGLIKILDLKKISQKYLLKIINNKCSVKYAKIVDGNGIKRILNKIKIK